MLSGPTQSLPIAHRRGACPTLRAPMQTGDGLLARLRPVGAAITPAQLQSIAALATQSGNGLLEITARGNLQIRGLRPDTVPAFADAVETVITIETGPPIETPPLAGLDPNELADPRPIAETIRQGLAESPLSAALGPKVTVIVDGGGTLDRLAADIRLRATATDAWTIATGRNVLGTLATAAAAPAVLTLLQMIVALGPAGRGRDLDPAAARQRLALGPATTPDPVPSASSPAPIALRDGTIAAPIALPFGAASASTLIALATAVQAIGIAQFRLAPQHGLIAFCANETIAAQFQSTATALGFVTTATDPRRAIRACIGNVGCASGLLPARHLADALAQAEPGFFDSSFTLHVSGCAKGCAHPGPALLTLTANSAGAGLIIDGTAGAEPALQLAPDALPRAIGRLANLWRDEATLEESVASCFKRLGAAAIVAAVRQGQL